jgi:hypothetical protein
MQPIINYLVESLGIDKNTSATIVLTLLIFILGYCISWLNTAISNYKLRRNYRRIFNDVITSISQNIQFQSKLFHEAHRIANIETIGNYNFKKGTITHLDSIDKLEFRDVYNSYLTGVENICLSKKKLKSFNKIYGRISLLKTIDSNLFSETDRMNDRYHESEQKWHESIDEMRQITDALHVQLNGQHFSERFSQYIEGMDRIILAWQQLENRTKTTNVKRHFVDRLLEHNRLFQNQRFQGDSIILQTNTVLLNAQHHFDNMVGTLEVLSNSFLSYHRTFRATKKILDVSMKILN